MEVDSTPQDLELTEAEKLSEEKAAEPSDEKVSTQKSAFFKKNTLRNHY